MGMETIQKPKVEVVLTPDGVEAVRLYGANWSDQAPAVSLFDYLAPWIQEVHLRLQGAKKETSLSRKPS